MADNKPRARAGNPKVRTGCRTCKLRRVKCDEAKPHCLRCRKSGWNCEGFSHLPLRDTTPKPIKPNGPVRILPKDEAPKRVRTKRNFLLEPSDQFRFRNREERVYFDIFQTYTAPELTGCFDTKIWNKLMLQACYEELYAWHAVVAIGALHRALEASSRDPSMSKTAHTFALKQYGIALRHMQQINKRRWNEYRLRDVLFSSLLTTCFESYIGNQDDALNQAVVGIKVLLDWTKVCPAVGEEDDITACNRLTSQSSFLDADLISAFVRLDFQVMQFNSSTIRAQQIAPRYPEIPDAFTSITQARYYWDMIVRRTQQMRNLQLSIAETIQSSTIDLPELLSHESSESDPDRIRRVRDELRAFEKVAELWYRRFKPLFDESRAEPGSINFKAASSMMVKYLPSRSAISIHASCGDKYADLYVDDYREVVRLVKEVLEEYSSPQSCVAVFEMDGSFVLSLFLVGTRCREPIVRREAIRLLIDHPRREGLWDSAMAARVCIWLMEREEEAMVDGSVPEAARLRIVKNDFVLKERKAIIGCSKLVVGSGERILLPDVTLTW